MTRAAPLRTPCLARPPDATARLRLFCFHHAGGAASAFAGWQEALGPDVSVVPVQLPGREARIREPRARDLGTLVADLSDELDPWLTGPHAYYGHSMGALLAYRLAVARARAGRPGPDRLLAGAFPAPHLPRAVVPAAELPDDDLVAWMTRIGGMSPALLEYPQWLAAMTAIVRDDLALCRSHRPDRPVPLDCPIDVFTGTTDPLVSRGDAAAWGVHTRAACRVHPVPGGHFFPRETFLPRLAAALAA